MLGRNEDPKNPLEEITSKCLDSEGYVMLVGIITRHSTGLTSDLNKRDDKGGKMIDFTYRRYHFAFEDVVTALKAFKQHLRDDIIKELLEEGEEKGG